MRQIHCTVGASLLAMTMAGSAAAQSETISYSYDALGRLVSSTRTGGPDNGLKTATCFDAAGNRSRYFVDTGSLPSCISTPAPTPTPTPTPTNHPPVAVNDSSQVIGCQSATIPALSNDSDPDGDPIHLVSVSSGMYGYTEIVGSSVVYHRSAPNTGTDSLYYVISDGDGGTDGANISVAVYGHINSCP